MANTSEQVTAVLRRLGDAGMAKDPDQIAALVHDQVVMVFPEFSGRSVGKANLLAGFEDFWQTASVQTHTETDYQVDVIGDTAVGSFRFEVTYQRDGDTYRSTGRDLWVFKRTAEKWLAVWRTMLDVSEKHAT